MHRMPRISYLLFPLAGVLSLLAAQALACAALPDTSAATRQMDDFAALRAREEITAALPALRQAQAKLTAATIQRELATAQRPEMASLVRAYALQLGAIWRIGETSPNWQMRAHIDSARFQSMHRDMLTFVAQVCPTAPARVAFGTNSNAFVAVTEAILGGLSELGLANGEVVAYGLSTAAVLVFLILLWLAHRKRRPRRRRTRRFACQIPTQLKIGNLQVDVTAVDIGEGGIALEYGFGIKEGDVVTVKFAGITRRATVVWCRERHSGLRFTRVLSRRDMQELIGRTGEAAPIAPLRPAKGH